MLEDPPNSSQGTDAGGFRVTLGASGRRLVIECWGYWEDETATLFTPQSLGALENSASPLDCTLDASALKPQSGVGQEALRVFLKALAKKSLGRVALRVNNVLTCMQLTRLVREAGLDSAEFSGSSNSAERV